MATSTINLGKIIITPRGAWNIQNEYKKLDLVYALDGSYIALKDNQGIDVTNSSTWQLIAGRGPAGSGNVSVVESGLEAGKKYLFIPSANNSAEGTFEEYTVEIFTQIQTDWNQTQADQPDFIKNKPELFSGDYNDLENKPSLFSGNYSDLTEKPELFSGSYSDLINQPTIPEKLSDLENDTQFISESKATTLFQRKESGKGLSANDYTTAEKEKLSGIETGAQKNIQSIHKTIVLESSDWQLFEDTTLYRVLVEDVQIIEGSIVDGGVDATDTVSYTAWKEAVGISGVFDTVEVGQFYVYAEKAATANINYKYTISL